MARSAAQAAETFSTEHGSTYAGLEPSALREYEPAIQTAAGGNDAYVSIAEAKESGKGYVVTAVAPTSKDTFTLTKRESGEVVRTCKAESTNKGGCLTGSW